jgi:hypothetical protein
LVDLISFSQVKPFLVDLWKCQNICYELLREISQDGQVVSNQPLAANLREVGGRVGIAMDFPQLAVTQSSGALALSAASNRGERALIHRPKDCVAILDRFAARKCRE